MSEEKAAQIVTQSVSVVRCRGCKTVLDVSAIEPFTRISCPNCAEEKIVPAMLGSYVLLERIGTGGMGAVYKGKDPALDRDIAIKVLLASMGSDEEVLEKFNHEAKAAAQLNHPNVAQIYAFGQESGQPYIVMEFIAGKSLKDLIVKDKYLDEAFVMRTGLEVAAGLTAASQIGLLHGDVKPENILFTESMEAKLIDFGLATFANQDAAEGIWGSPYYIAPEKVRQQDANERADIYSLGGTLYHALCNAPPFNGETAEEVVKKRLNMDPGDLGERRHGVSETVQQIIARMLKRSPNERYPNYKSLSSDLSRAVDELSQSTGRRSARHTKSTRIYSDIAPKRMSSSGNVHTARRPATRSRHATGIHGDVPQRRSADHGARAAASSRDSSKHVDTGPGTGSTRTASQPRGNKTVAITVAAVLLAGGILLAVVMSRKGGGGTPAGRRAWSTRPAPAQQEGGLFSENFGSGKANGFTSPLGYWMVQKARYHGLAKNENEWTISLINLDKELPAKFVMQVSVKTRESRTMKNGYIVLDYVSPQNYKFAGMRDGPDEWVIGFVTDKGENTAASVKEPIDTGKEYRMAVVVDKSVVKLLVNGAEKLSHEFEGGTLADGRIGVGSRDGHSSFDDIVISP